MSRSRAPGGGRKPKPTVFKMLAGNPGKRPLNANEAEPDPTMPECPDTVQGEARLEWDRVSVLLHSCGLLSSIDRAALTVYCLAWGRMIDAERKLLEHGVVIMSPKQFPMQSPYLAIANKAREEMMRALSEFGMTPSSRTKVHAAPPEGKESERARNKREFFGAS